MPPEGNARSWARSSVPGEGRFSLRTSGSRKASAIAEPLDCGVRSWRIWLGSA